MMMIKATQILGHVDDPRFRGRRVERIALDSVEASKRILRRRTDAGTEVAIELPRGSFLADGAVVADDGERIVTVTRTLEDALIVKLADDLTREQLIEAAARVGHAFGNQHVPIEVIAGALQIPVTTSPEVARATVESLGLSGVVSEIKHVSLGLSHPLPVGHAH